MKVIILLILLNTSNTNLNNIDLNLIIACEGRRELGTNLLEQIP